MTEFKILTGKEALTFWTREAVERQYKNQSFTDEEVTTIFGSLESVFGESEASGFLNLVIETWNKHKGRMTFNRAVVETIANYATGPRQ